MFYFEEFLEKLGLDVKHTRLIRHDQRGLSAWQSCAEQKFEKLGCFASFQNKKRSPYLGANLACHFIPGPTLPDGNITARFVGITEIGDRWLWDGKRLPVLQDRGVIDAEKEITGPDREAFDLKWLDIASHYSELLLVKWGPANSARAWTQWAVNKPKEIIEIRLDRHEPAFPGYAMFKGKISEISIMPQAWQACLECVKGVYLLVAGNGEQYVGSASGEDGFFGRWKSYAQNGHGGNKLLISRGHKDYIVSILEVSSPDMSRENINAREQHWKDKLGSRAHGLNAN